MHRQFLSHQNIWLKDGTLLCFFFSLVAKESSSVFPYTFGHPLDSSQGSFQNRHAPVALWSRATTQKLRASGCAAHPAEDSVSSFKDCPFNICWVCYGSLRSKLELQFTFLCNGFLLVRYFATVHLCLLWFNTGSLLFESSGLFSLSLPGAASFFSDSRVECPNLVV